MADPLPSPQNQDFYRLSNVPPTKSAAPGWRTTEFWSMFVTSMVAICNAAFGWHIDATTMATVAAMVAGYAISRGQAKKAV